jgi:hypothetical protein
MWILRRLFRHPPQDQLACFAAENAQLRGLISQLAEENAILRGLASNLDAAVLDLSQQLWGPEAVARVLDQAKRNGNN